MTSAPAALPERPEPEPAPVAEAIPAPKPDPAVELRKRTVMARRGLGFGASTITK